ncbi:MAG: hypothetical protein II920_07435 [Clostridia bacterium]|nr:hypothetical protein [Clostridia bacterium]
MPSFKQRIAEREPRRNAVFIHKPLYVPRSVLAKADAPSAPEAIGGGAVDRADLAPIVKILPVLAKQRQIQAVELVEFKQTRQVVVSLHKVNFMSRLIL